MLRIYPSYYTVDGVKKEIISTEAICPWSLSSVDEPEAKTTFDLALKWPSRGELALSNMPEIDVENRKATGIWKFERTPRIFLSLGPCCWGYAGITAKTKNGTLVGVCNDQGSPSQQQSLLPDIAVRSIEFYRRVLRCQIPDSSVTARCPAGLFIWCYGKLGTGDHREFIS